MNCSFNACSITKLGWFSESRWDGDLNFIALDLNLAASDLEVRVTDSFSRNDAEFPAMPGAFDNRLAQFPFSERAARMGTGVIDRVETSLHVEDRNPNSIDFHGSSRARRNLVREGHSDEIVHHGTRYIGPPDAAPEGRSLDFNATLWHRTIRLHPCPAETVPGRCRGSIGDEVPAWK